MSNLPTQLPETTEIFLIDCSGNLTKKTYTGEFTCKIPNLKDQANIAKYKATLNQGLDDILDIGTRNLHHMVSYLKYTLLKSPDWFEKSNYGYELYDANVIEEVYQKVLDFESKWVTEVWGKDE